jgi:glycosyltransferase involved in cell wall biosynthesis
VSEPGLPVADAVDVSVVLPVFNEAGHVVDEVKRIRAGLERSPYRFEIIVVDDGSTDGSTEQLSELEGVRIIRFGHNRGTGSARKAGTRAARAPVVVWTDADMTYPNEDIPRLVTELEGWDQVVGARTSEQGTARALRVPAKWFMRKLASYLTHTRIPDLNSGFRAFRKPVAEQFLHLLPPGFSCVSTMTLSFLANGYTVKHIPIEYSVRSGESKFSWWSDSRRYLTQVIRMVMSYDPLRVLMPPGVILTLVGLLKVVFDLVNHPFRIATDTLLVLSAAVQIIVVALLADLVVRLNRPRQQVDPADQ